MSKPHTGPGLSRRMVVASVPLVSVSALVAAVPPTPAFSSDQRKTLEALVNRLIPADELGPGAVEAGVPVYFERSFAGPLSSGKTAFLQSLAAVDAASHARHGSHFAELSPARQDDLLAAMERNEVNGFSPDSRAFFNRLRQLTLEGMFGDPWYGGNANFAGWDLIRYPGPRLAASAEDQSLKPPKPLRVSARGRR